jgi:hypothetical protein
MLVSDDHKSVLSEVGYERYERLLSIFDQYLVIGDKLMK